MIKLPILNFQISNTYTDCYIRVHYKINHCICGRKPEKSIISVLTIYILPKEHHRAGV